MTKPDLQRCWIIAILMLMFSLQVHEFLLSIDHDPEQMSPAHYLGMIFGWAGAIFTFFLIAVTARKLETAVKREWREFWKEAEG